ncbi:hypothetical protein BKA63DRAFT_415021 [Paraphoma chrysanthemicola]|nr:hypothetical protein BKA63DRAFT_415021 [Paraphoma chrysanthemicola]
MPPQNPTGNRSFHFSTGGGQAGGFNFSNADDIFAEFMKSGGGADFGKPSGKNDESSPVVTVVEKQLLVSLEELFNGTTKRLNLKRKTYDRETGQEATQDRVLELPIKKGLKAGSKIKFSNVGDQVEGGTQDVHFIVAEKPHDLYKRVSDDLHHIVEISLLESLVGWERTVMTIDGKHLKVASKGPTGPTWTERFPSLGMPNSKKPNERGELVIELSINKYPTSLTLDEKEMLMRVLGDKSVS